jgi:ribosomal protein S27AE
MQFLQPITHRILFHLAEAEAEELDLWLRDDLRIARLTVAYAANGEASSCAPNVVASYEVLGLHPEKVWPAILARREAMGWPRANDGAVPKKPAQSVKLWWDKSKSARAVNSRASDVTVLREPPTNEPMAAPSIAALYRNPGDPSSAKTRLFSYQQLLDLVRYSGAPHAVKAGTTAAILARGPWPNQDGSATPIIKVSLKGVMIEGGCCRSTAQRRVKRALKLGYWTRLREGRQNVWENCPKCGTAREMAKCGKCGYRGNRRNKGEFCPTFTHEINVEKFLSAPRCREIHSVNWRTYAEYKAAARLGEHPNVTEMPRKHPAPEPPPKSPAPAAPLPQRNTAAHQRTVVNTQITERARKGAERIVEYCGLADLGAIPQIAISIVAESKFAGIEIEDAAKYIAERALEQQKKGEVVNRFYFRDTKWRSANGQQSRPSAGAERAERSRRNILDGLATDARRRDSPDLVEREIGDGKLPSG